MKDIYLMNKKTGEIEPSEKVIRDYYKTHKWNERWTDEWTETKFTVSETSISMPDFKATVNS